MIQRSLQFAIATILLTATPTLAQTLQWQWAKKLSVSVKTDWDASHVDDEGNFYFVGTSEKFVGNTPARAIVVSKWNSDTTKQWSKNFIGGNTATASRISTDPDGNVIFIAKFSGVLTRTDGTTMEHPLSLEAYAVGKLDKDGNELWTKKLTLVEIKHLQVLPNGSIGIIGINNNGGKAFVYGDSTIESGMFATHFLEISADGGVRHSANSAQFNGASGNLLHMHWESPGVIRIIALEGNFPPLPMMYAEVDLATRVYKALDTIFVTGGNASSLYMDMSAYDPVNKRVIAIMRAGSKNMILGEKDTLRSPSNNVNKEGYVVEFDESMNIVNLIRVTNPEHIAVRDTQVVLGALLHTNFGFISDEVSIPWTKPTLGHVVYVMDREFKYRRHATMRPQTSGSFIEEILIDRNGGVYLHTESNYDLIFDNRVFDAPSHSDASIIVLAKVAGSSTAEVAATDISDQRLAVYPNPSASVLNVQIDALASYRLLDMVGRVVSSGKTFGTINVSGVVAGSYILSLDIEGRIISTPVRVSR